MQHRTGTKESGFSSKAKERAKAKASRGSSGGGGGSTSGSKSGKESSGSTYKHGYKEIVSTSEAADRLLSIADTAAQRGMTNYKKEIAKLVFEEAGNDKTPTIMDESDFSKVKSDIPTLYRGFEEPEYAEQFSYKENEAWLLDMSGGNLEIVEDLVADIEAVLDKHSIAHVTTTTYRAVMYTLQRLHLVRFKDFLC